MFSSSLVALLPLLSFTPRTLAAPVPLFGINLGEGSEATGNPTPISQSTITDDLLRPALFARTAYCPSSTLTDWSCGAPCNALPGVNVFTAGGDDGEIPFYYVASDPQTQTIVVAHEGTDPENFYSDLNDIKFSQVAINATRFPQAGSNVQVHDGFQETQGRTADTILSTVQSALASTGYTNVLVTGHSLGAAVASLDAAMLKMALPSNIEIGSVVFGLPRVGNQEWADLVGSLLPSFTHVTNQNDPVPRVPPRALSFVQPVGEAHITAVNNSTGDATMEECPGQENEVRAFRRAVV
ncbi:alpha/beta-hydrolase [Wolfiporia cocos MD-104 SS10]|uniref:Alpha/beta-hydrolase n=1 Tax=Wolfiporia cocos (strain MD-104) TaxID=742152 RepID=A0A2H3JKI0_WOLCO|nr:alpha/beta-hydrolase [Wolfiporia cocos MD-104 SS10]